MTTLRPYQREALDAIHASYKNGHRRQLVVLPTGTGKTVLFSSLASEAKGRRLILVHRDELVRQTVSKLADAGLDNVGVVKGEQDDCNRLVTVASVQTLSRQRRLDAFLRFGQCSLIVVDEAHHAPARTYVKVIDACLTARGLLVGVTATPDRQAKDHFILPTGAQVTTIKGGMRRVFDHLTYYRSLSDMVGEGWLCDVVPATIKADMSLRNVSDTAGDWAAGELGAEMAREQIFDSIVTAWESHGCNDRPTIAFFPTVETSQMAQAAFASAGYAAEHIDGTTPAEDRQMTYKRLRSGETRVVTNCMVLTEGFDEPSVSCVIVGRPTQSRPLFAQMIGRGTRLYPDKRDCLVMSVVSHDLDLSPVTLQSFLNDDDWQDGQTMADRKKELVEKLGAQQIKDDAEKEALRQEALQFVQRFSATPSAKSSLRWRKIGPQWVLVAGNVTVTLLERGEDHWLPLAERTGEASVPLGQPVTLAEAIPLAEQYVTREGATILAREDAPWRKAPSTPAQWKFAAGYGMKKAQAQTMTKGELSDWITNAKLTKGAPAWARKKG